VREALRRYVSIVATREWPAMADQTSAPEADSAIDGLIKAAVGTAPAASGDLARARMLVAAEAIRQAREIRLSLAAQSVESIRWLVVLLLALLTQIGIALVHLERRRAQLVALMVFSTALTLMISLAALYEYPFSPPFEVSVTPISSLAAQFGE